MQRILLSGNPGVGSCVHMRRDFESTKYEKICGAKKVKKNSPSHLRGGSLFSLCSFYFSGSQTRSADIHLLGSAVSCLNLNRLYIGFPHFIGSSMGMTYIISEMSTFFANCALSHDSTSLTLFFNRFYCNRSNLLLQAKKGKM